MTQIAAQHLAEWDHMLMNIWVLITVVAMISLYYVDARDASNKPTRSWNIWFGLNPREGESRTRYTLRRAQATLVAFIAVVIPLMFVSSPFDESSSFSGNESIIGMAVFMIFAPLTAMAFVSFVGLLISSLVSVIFRRDQVFHVESGEFLWSGVINIQNIGDG